MTNSTSPIGFRAWAARWLGRLKDTGAGTEFLADDGTYKAVSGGSTPTGTGFRHVTAGVEDAASKLVENADVHASAGIAESKLSLNFATHSNANDPSSGEKAALAGTTGTPGAGNKYVTDTDARMTNARTPSAHAASHQHSGGDEIATATPGANAIPKAGAGGTLNSGWIPTLDHGSALSGLGDDDHTQYLLASGARALSGSLDLNGNLITKLLQIKDTNGALILDLFATASAVNYFLLQNHAAGSAPRLTATGSDTNVDMVLATKGTGRVKARYSSTTYEVACVDLAQTLTNKTLTTPTIADFTNAGHSHQNAAGGGTLDAAALGSGTIATARLGSGTPSATNALLGNQTYGNPAPGAHTTSHKHGGSDEVATATAAANAIPKAGSSGLLDYGWIPVGGECDFAKAGTTNYTAMYFVGNVSGVALTTKAMVANTAYAVPFIAPRRGGTLDRIEVRVTTGVASTNIRAGIYENSSESGLYPGTLLLDAGAGSSASSSSTISLTISQALTPGKLYWLVLVSDGAPTIRAGSANCAIGLLGYADATQTSLQTHLTATLTYGALPGTFPGSPTAGTGAVPGAFIRFSA